MAEGEIQQLERKAGLEQSSIWNRRTPEEVCFFRDIVSARVFKICDKRESHSFLLPLKTLVKFRSRHFGCISCLVGSCSVPPWNNSNLILRFPFSVSLTLGCNSLAADAAQASQFCFSCYIYTSNFPSKCPQEYQGSTAETGDHWRSFLKSLEHDMCCLKTAWIQF